MPRLEDVQEIIWKHARVSADWLQGLHRGQLEDQGRVRGDGYVYATPEPKDLVLFVCGGLGGLHALGLHSFGSALAQTKSIATAVPAAGAVAAA